MGYDVLAIAPTSFFADYGCHVRILEEARALGRRGHRVTVCTYHSGRDPQGVRVRRIPRVPWHAEVRVGSHYHKLYFDALLAARSLLASLGRVDVVHAHLHDGALIGYFVSRLRRVPLVFDYQGSLAREMVDHQFLRRGEPALRPGGQAGAHHRRPGGRDPDQLHQRRRGAFSPGSGRRRRANGGAPPGRGGRTHLRPA